jgi:hypothetical protein
VRSLKSFVVLSSPGWISSKQGQNPLKKNESQDEYTSRKGGGRNTLNSVRVRDHQISGVSSSSPLYPSLFKIEREDTEFVPGSRVEFPVLPRWIEVSKKRMNHNKSIFNNNNNNNTKKKNNRD